VDEAVRVGSALKTRTASSEKRRGLSTPALLKLALGLSWLFSGLLCAVVLAAWAQQERSAKTLGVDSAPSVVAAHQIRIHIETLDADLANELISKPGQATEVVSDFDKNRLDIGQQIVAASKNITYGDAELIPIENIEDSLGRYLMAAEAARDAHNRGDHTSALAEYRKSLRVMEENLVPAAGDLNSANDSVLQGAYVSQKSTSTWTLVLTLFVGATFILLLIVIQVYVTRAFRRRLNPALALATVVAVVFLGNILLRFGSHADDLKRLKEDSYDSVAALLHARAEAYEANAAESRWLLDPEERPLHERTFRESAAKLVSFKGGQNFENANAIAERRNALLVERLRGGDAPLAAASFARSQLPLEGMDGEFRNALDNITFPDKDPIKDEPTQSAATLRAFGVYYGLDAHIRDLELAGKHDEAVSLCTGMKEGDSNWAFFKFDQSLGNWLKLNQDWMDRYTQAALGDPAGLQYYAPIVSIFIAVMVFFGLRPRIREYSV
jgi:hypothetical protein